MILEAWRDSCQAPDQGSTLIEKSAEKIRFIYMELGVERLEPDFLGFQTLYLINKFKDKTLDKK